MKKSLFALAALGAFAGVAQAQSSVTLYGAMDASVQNIIDGGVDRTATNSSIANGTSTPAASGCAVCLVDGAIATSLWGLKGVEDLGGGMKAMFKAESDILVNNGTTHSSGLFRRAANVGIGGGFGTVSLGLVNNPLVEVSSASFAVGGNTVHQVRNVVGYAFGDFIKNSVRYDTPNLGGLAGALTYGMSDTIGDNSATVLAASAFYDNGALRLSAGYNKATAGSMTNAVTASFTTAGAGYSGNTYASAADSGTYDQTGYLLGAKYTLGKLVASYAFAHGEFTRYSDNTPSRTTSYTANSNVNMFSLGYNVTPTLLLGANYQITTADSSFYNLQARYSLSKRTTIYAQGSMAKNGAGATSSGAAYGNYMPVNTNSASTTVGGTIANVGGYGLVSGSSYSGGLPNTSSTAIGVGVIHNF